MPRRKTHDEFINEIESKFPNTYTFHTQYVHSDIKVDTEHMCGYRWLVNPKNLLGGKSKCPQCNGKHNKTPKEFCDYVESETNREFSSLGDFKGIKHITTFKHNSCGYIFKAYPFHVRKGELGCRQCSNMLIHNTERVKLLLEDKYGTEYSLISEEVTNNRDSIIVKHNVCNKEFDTISNKIINQGSVCPHCNISSSKGEMEIEKTLKNNKMKYKKEWSFDDCRHKGLLFFDFAVFDETDELKCLIEFDGKQHYEPVNFFGGIEGFKTGQLRDEIKNDYCKEKGIKLLRIPYWDENNIARIILDYFSSECRLIDKEVV